MTVSMKRILAAVYPPENAGALVILATAIIKRMDGNPYFAQPVPSLAMVKAAIGALQKAETVSQSRRRGTKQARDEARAKLSSLLTRLKAYVQGIADDDPDNAVSIIESAGMSVQPKGVKAKPLFEARHGSLQGTVLLAVKAAAKEAAYHWQMSEDGRVTWIDLPTTLQAKTKVNHLVRGHTYWFRYSVLTRRGTSDVSDAVSLLVQ